MKDSVIGGAAESDRVGSRKCEAAGRFPEAAPGSADSLHRDPSVTDLPRPLLQCGFFKRKYQQLNLESMRKVQLTPENLLPKDG